jgi:hypothetical protein
MEIRHRRTLEFVGSPNLRRRVSNFGIWALESRDIYCRILAIVAGIRKLLPDSNQCRQNLAS